RHLLDPAGRTPHPISRTRLVGTRRRLGEAHRHAHHHERTQLRMAGPPRRPDHPRPLAAPWPQARTTPALVRRRRRPRRHPHQPHRPRPHHPRPQSTPGPPHHFPLEPDRPARRAPSPPGRRRPHHLLRRP